VTWIGGSTGNWFDSTKWEDGAVPDLANVSTVRIPAGVTVTYDPTVASNTSGSTAVSVVSITGTLVSGGVSPGALSQTGGTLNVMSMIGIIMLMGLVTKNGILLIDFVEVSRTVGGRGDAGFPKLLWLTLLKAPSTILTLLPFAFLFGTLAAFVGLNRRSELIAMRAAGVSAWRFILPATAAAFLVGAVTVAALNPLTAMLGAQFEQSRDAVLEEFQTSTPKDTWLRQGDIRLLATDLAPHVIEATRRGVYSASTIEPVPAAYRAAWVQPSGNDFVMAQEARTLVTARVLNLFDPWPMRHQYDVIFCRNVMIYFNDKAKAELEARFLAMLAPGGYLYIGHSERLIGAAAHGMTACGQTTYVKHGGSAT
jgi:SAM-dependent methyltransferase